MGFQSFSGTFAWREFSNSPRAALRCRLLIFLRFHTLLGGYRFAELSGDGRNPAHQFFADGVFSLQPVEASEAATIFCYLRT